MRRALCWALLALAAGVQAQGTYGQRDDVKAFIGELVARHGFVESELNTLFSRVQRVDAVLQSIQPAERPSWEDYRAQFVNERRIGAGAAFWRAHRARLEQAERAYGVPPQFIAAIIGIETNYGRTMGRWRVVDALSTLAFDYPPRASFFRAELEQYLLLARDAHLDVFALRGSYAGAIGIPQFMPGSLRRYAVDFDGDGRIDLRASAADAIGSVGNFLQQHGWRAGERAAFRARLTREEARSLADGSVQPRQPLAEIVAAGVELEPAPRAADGPGVLVALGTEYRVALQNFYVVTRYNRSALYAAAVCDLAQALAERVQSAGR
jgi:membrane-bound lytic murein transglycosylase B